jgi:D-arabinose 1-dehydrogenase-like Zn-dependent alcohol dehydrogenase
MGATVIGISSGNRKYDVAKELGCDDYINTSDEASMAKFNNKLTHILLTGTTPDFEWQKYYNLIKFNGHFLNVSAPDWDFPKMNAFTMLFKQINLQGSAIGSPADIEEMLQFVQEKKIKPWIDIYPMSEVNKAIEDFRAGKPRFRFVLEN